MNQNLARGVALTAIALGFGLGAFRYPIGQFERAGPGLFPLVVSSFLLLIGITTVIRSLLIERQPMQFQFKNIAIILLSLCGFALLSEFVNMILGIVFLVFFAMLADPPYSIKRNLVVAAVLVAIALGFQQLLGLQLPLF
ncbi:MAG TPA: tripartite tricarboxylate transporter TctB family protein [Candidatus Acidoferrales bacterium]|nr:tripartite tricarboxylate transporter TctB family protein [Candidatus Acidoferrales bacterium]